MRTLRWPLVGDSTLIHYAVFLMDTGSRPYVDFRGVNLPGSYLVDWLVIHVLGPGALAERIYDFALSAVALLAMLYLSPRRLRFAGLFAGCMFFLLHVRDGARQSGQRDLSLTVFLLLAFAFSFAAMRRGKAWPYLFAGILVGAATIVKPMAILFLAPLCIGMLADHAKRARAATPALAFLASGSLLPLALMAAWLTHEGALRAFLTTGLAMMQYHASLHHLPWGLLILRSISPLLPLLAAGILLLPFAGKKLHTGEFAMLCGAVAAAFLYYIIQAKGSSYQRYPFAAFLLLTLGLVFTVAMQEGTAWRRWLAVAALGAGCLVIAPSAASHAIAYRPQDDQFGDMLTSDLRSLGTDGLRGNVQCLDTFSGCIRILYDLRLRQSTDTFYDEFLFTPSDPPVIANNRADFAREIAARPPEAVIVTPQFYSAPRDGYNKLQSWPAFAAYLSRNYTLYVQRTPTRAEFWEGAPQVPLGYRIYLRRQ